MYRYLNPLIRHMRIVVGVGLLLGLVAGLLVVIEPPQYTSESTFLPQAPDSRTNRIAGLAEQFGFSVGQSSAGESIEFYAALLRSRALLGEVITTEYTSERGRSGQQPWRGTLLERYELDAETPEGRYRQALNRVRQATQATVEPATGLVHVQATSDAPDIADQINRRMLKLVNEFNLVRRQSQAGAEREFVAARLTEAEQNLREAEGELETFLEANRHYEESPQLRFEAARLERQVALQQQIHGGLAESLEQARIAEVRNLPVLTVVDAPEGSAKREPRRLLLTVALGLFAGLVMGAGLVLGRQFLDRQRKVFPEDYSEFRRLKEERLQVLPDGLRRSRHARGESR